MGTSMIVDYIDNLRVTDENKERLNNELQVHRRLARGLEYLYEQVLRIETDVRMRIHLDGRKHISFAGNNYYGRDVPFDLISCSFDWYAVSVCNYVRVVGLLAYGGDQAGGKQYYYRILPSEVITYRNKVAAHVAFAMSDCRDTQADRMVSGFPPKWDVIFRDDAFYAADFRVTLGKDMLNKGTFTPIGPSVSLGKAKVTPVKGSLYTGEVTSVNEDMNWSLTKLHKQLVERYWPSGRP